MAPPVVALTAGPSEEPPIGATDVVGAPVEMTGWETSGSVDEPSDRALVGDPVAGSAGELVWAELSVPADTGGPRVITSDAVAVPVEVAETSDKS